MASFVRFNSARGPAWGVIASDGVTVRAVEGSVFDNWKIGSAVGAVCDLDLIPPCKPQTVAALAYNFKDLVGPRETYEEPLVFLKSPAAVIGSRENIRRPQWIDKMWVEVEIGVVVRTPIFEATRSEAAAAILGLVITNDVTATNIGGRDHHLARSKSLATFCPVGDVLHTDINANNLILSTSINGKMTQYGNTNNRICDEVDAVMLVSRMMPLVPGDLILTGTPAGAMDSIVEPGDDVELIVESLGRLNNQITQGEKEF